MTKDEESQYVRIARMHAPRSSRKPTDIGQAHLDDGGLDDFLGTAPHKQAQDKAWKPQAVYAEMGKRRRAEGTVRKRGSERLTRRKKAQPQASTSESPSTTKPKRTRGRPRQQSS